MNEVAYSLLNLLIECLFVLGVDKIGSDVEGTMRRWKIFWKVKVP